MCKCKTCERANEILKKEGKKICPECNGTGHEGENDWYTCYNCGGLEIVTIGGPADTAPHENVE